MCCVISGSKQRSGQGSQEILDALEQGNEAGTDANYFQVKK